MVKIDVVIPCYNYGRFLAGCVNSVLSQSISELRVLIIDDASVDDTRLVGEQLAAADSRVEYSRHTENQGHIDTYNEGIAWAKADYFLLLSADDLLAPGAFSRAFGVLNEEPSIVMIYGKCIEWRDDTAMPSLDLTKEPWSWEQCDLIDMICSSAVNCVPTPTAIVRTSVQKKVGGYDPRLPHSGDMEMWLRVATQGGVGRIDSSQAVYRKHASAMSASYDAVGDVQQRKSAFDLFFSKCLGDRPDLMRHKRRADRSIAADADRVGALHLRRGRFGSGLQLLRLARDLDPGLRYRFPLWQLLKMPGPEGRDWAASLAKKRAMKLLGRG